MWYSEPMPGNRKNRVTMEETTWMVELHRSGLSSAEIALKSGVRNADHVRKILKRSGVYQQERTLVTEEERSAIVALYLSGLSTTDVCEQTGRGAGHIAQIVAEAGVSRGHLGGIRLGLEQGKGRKEWPNQLTAEEDAQTRDFYAQGLSSNDIGDKLGRDGRYIRDHLARLGLTRSRRDGIRNAVSQGKIKTVGKTLNEHFFDELTPESAWVLGLIYGDGHVFNVTGQNYGVKLAGSQEICEKVRALINPALKIRKDKTECWLLTWCSREMVETLGKYGLAGGNKARTIRLPALPEHLMGHFCVVFGMRMAIGAAQVSP